MPHLFPRAVCGCYDKPTYFLLTACPRLGPEVSDLSKVMSMRDAISQSVRSGDLVFLSGAQHGSTTAAIAEIVRQRIDHLSIVAVLSGGTDLIGEGLVDKLITGYTPMNEKLCYPLSKASAMGKFPIVEETSPWDSTRAKWGCLSCRR
jgi:hypothetical protein